MWSKMKRSMCIAYRSLLQSSLSEQFSCWRPLLRCARSEVSGSRLWLSSLVYTPSSIHDAVRLKNIVLFLCGRDPSTWLMFITRDNDSRTASVFWNDVNVLRAALLRGHPPAAHMLTALPLLLRLWWLFLQLLSLVLGPSVLEPDFHLDKNEKERPFQYISLSSQSQIVTYIINI